MGIFELKQTNYFLCWILKLCNRRHQLTTSNFIECIQSWVKAMFLYEAAPFRIVSPFKHHPQLYIVLHIFAWNKNSLFMIFFRRIKPETWDVLLNERTASVFFIRLIRTYTKEIPDLQSIRVEYINFALTKTTFLYRVCMYVQLDFSFASKCRLYIIVSPTFGFAFRIACLCVLYCLSYIGYWRILYHTTTTGLSGCICNQGSKIVKGL